MSSDSGAHYAKPTTRSSIRQSLNLTSVGKALGEIINKSGDSALKKPRDSNPSRSTAFAHKPPAPPRTSSDTLRLSPPRKDEHPDSKTLTQSRIRRLSVTSKPPTDPSDVDSLNPLQTSAITRSLRSRNSALPKPRIRPKSVVVTSNGKPPSPLRASTRRPLSCTDDEREVGPRSSNEVEQRTIHSPAEKMARAISPLPYRATFKTNFTAVNIAAPSTPPKKLAQPPSSKKMSPNRPAKLAKSEAGPLAQSAHPRPPSSTSSSPKHTLRTPKGSAMKSASGNAKSGRENIHHESSSFRTSHRSPPESPSPRRPQKVAKNAPSCTQRPFSGNMSHISEGDSADLDDIAALLAPVAPLTAPTPAMPRLQYNRKQSTLQPPPQTRPSLCYLSATPPDRDNSPNLLPPGQNNKSWARTSILSWEQVAAESSRTLGSDEIETMLSDVPAPFLPDPASPSPRSRISIPDSPCLTELHSPGEYRGSISQVLLPDVTPSPAFPRVARRYDSVPGDSPVVEGAIAALMKWKATGEDTASNQLSRLQSLEEEISTLKEAHIKEKEALEMRVLDMEGKIRRDNDERHRAEEEQVAYVAALEDQVRHDQVRLDQAVQDAVDRTSSSARILQEGALRQERYKWEVAGSARDASVAWMCVGEAALSDLEHVRTGMETLSALLAGLECQWRAAEALS